MKVRARKRYSAHEFAAMKTFIETLPTPKEIKAHLDQFVVGQERAKKIMSVGIYNHYKRIWGTQLLLRCSENKKNSLAEDSVRWNYRYSESPCELSNMVANHICENADQVSLSKSNMLFIGPTGCGKTFIAQTIAKFLQVPFVIFDCSGLSSVGYQGEKVKTILFQLHQSAEGDIKKTEKGIVFLDEIDKIKATRGGYRDVGGRGVQQNLLKMVEGSSVLVPKGGDDRYDYGPMLTIDTTNILFIASGAFCGLDDIVNLRSGTVPDSDSFEWLNEITIKDLIKFGMIPEFIGRFPTIASFLPLDESALLKILNETKGSLLGEYKTLFALDQVELELNKSALVEIARIALGRGTGARGLRSVMENLLLDTMFEVPKSDICHVEISEETVLGHQPAKLSYRSDRPDPQAELDEQPKPLSTDFQLKSVYVKTYLDSISIIQML